MDEVGERAAALGHETSWRQSDHEGDLVGLAPRGRGRGRRRGRREPRRALALLLRAARRDRGLRAAGHRGAHEPTSTLARSSAATRSSPRSAGRPSPASGPVAIIWRWRRCRGSPHETNRPRGAAGRPRGRRGARDPAAERPVPDRVHRLERADARRVRPDAAGGEGVFFTDGRYTEQSRHEVPDMERVTYAGAFAEALGARGLATRRRAAGLRGRAPDGPGARAPRREARRRRRARGRATTRSSGCGG